MLCNLAVPETDDETTEQKDEQFEKVDINGTSSYFYIPSSSN